MRKLVLYGDSNTYGYDPGIPMGGRYPAEARWPDLLSGLLGEEWKVIAHGLNGRKIPEVPESGDYVLKLLEEAGEDGIFVVMLGSNDLMGGSQPDAESAIRKMRRFLPFVAEHHDPGQILVLAPPFETNWFAMTPLILRYMDESMRMNQAFRRIALETGAVFIDTEPWHLSISFDHSHLSEEGNRQMAQYMKKEIFLRYGTVK